jgi:hypothetical protein
MKPHKYAVLIKAWADGAKIEQRNYDDYGGYFDWFFTDNPIWNSCDSQFRIKPEPTPDFVRNFYINHLGMIPVMDIHSQTYNLKLTWDGETGELKDAKVIK